MTPTQQKAKELVDKFYLINSKTDTCFGDCNSENVLICDHTGHGCGLWLVHAKQSALLAIEEILNLFQGLEKLLFIATFNFWEDVKKEIQNL